MTLNDLKGRFITKEDKNALKELFGFFFGNGKIIIYEYRPFGKTNYNRRITPILGMTHTV